MMYKGAFKDYSAQPRRPPAPITWEATALTADMTVATMPFWALALLSTSSRRPATAEVAMPMMVTAAIRCFFFIGFLLFPPSTIGDGLSLEVKTNLS